MIVLAGMAAQWLGDAAGFENAFTFGQLAYRLHDKLLPLPGKRFARPSLRLSTVEYNAQLHICNACLHCASAMHVCNACLQCPCTNYSSRSPQMKSIDFPALIAARRPGSCLPSYLYACKGIMPALCEPHIQEAYTNI